ncbi:MAG: prolyl oligopeptidase family serine peptidase [Verrucomicrobiales bacterium]
MKFVIGLLIVSCFAAQLLAQGQTEKEPAKPTAHILRNVEGWQVQVDERLLSGPDEPLGTHSLRLLASRLYDLKSLLPADKLPVLQKYTIWLDLSHGKLVSAQYHPSAGWLRDNGYSEKLAKCVHIPDAQHWSNAHHHKIQPWSILHELAHAYHDQELSFNNPEIKKVWESFKTKESYQKVLHRGGGKQKHYALTDPMEFFAEMTEAYFAENDFYPFNRAELQDAEPEVYHLLQRAWQGKLETKPAKVLPLPGKTFEMAGRAVFLIEAEQPARGKPWVWYAPTLPGYPAKEEKWMFERFLSNGIAIAGIDVGESYGSPKGTELFNKLHQKLSTEFGYSSKPILLARSRGGLMLYNWAIENPHSVGAIAAIYPVANLESYPGIAKAAEAYEKTADELQNDLKKFNPIARVQVLAERKVPIFHIHGDIDALVPLEANTTPIKTVYDAHSAPMEVVVPKGQGHNMWEGFFQSQELVDFVLEQAAKQTKD